MSLLRNLYLLNFWWEWKALIRPSYVNFPRFINLKNSDVVWRTRRRCRSTGREHVSFLMEQNAKHHGVGNVGVVPLHFLLPKRDFTTTFFLSTLLSFFFFSLPPWRPFSCSFYHYFFHWQVLLWWLSRLVRLLVWLPRGSVPIGNNKMPKWPLRLPVIAH